jgi:SAM-dependent methyltransferase
MHSKVTWPKVRPDLTPEQETVMADWYSTFLGEVLPGRFGWIDRFNHSYAAHSGQPGDRTLEIGPGNGSHLAFENLDDHVEYVGVELRETLSKQIVDRHPNVKILEGDCQQGLDFADSTFDRVLAIHVLEHLDNLPKALDEVVRILKPGGRLSVVIPCEGGLGYSLGRRVTVQRSFERRYGLPYAWMINYEHVNQAWEILQELKTRFLIDDVRYFPLRVRLIDLNLVVGLTLSPLR